MSINSLLNVPKTAQDWAAWSFAHKDHHSAIRQAIFRKTNGADNLAEYELDPINFESVKEWLARNQQSHDDFNLVLGLEGTDLEGLDVEDKGQLATWVMTHWQEHQNAAAALKI